MFNKIITNVNIIYLHHLENKLERITKKGMIKAIKKGDKFKRSDLFVYADKGIELIFKIRDGYSEVAKYTSNVDDKEYALERVEKYSEILETINKLFDESLKVESSSES